MSFVREDHQGWNMVLSVFLAVVIAVCLVLLMRTPNSATDVQNQSNVDETISVLMDYPAEWATTTDKAIAEARFQVPVPDVPEANEHNAKEAYLSEGGTSFALVYSNPGDPSGVAEEGMDIEVYGEPYVLTDDPRSVFESDAESIGQAGSVRMVHGVDALVVEPLSDQDGDNPAFVRLVLNGVDIEVHGGTDLDLILKIANSLKLR